MANAKKCDRCGKYYDYSYEFYMSDKENDVDTMNKCKSMLRNLLV